MKLRNKTFLIRKINTIGIDQFCNPFVPIPWEYQSRWSRFVKTRDSRRCKVCGTRKGVISHHIIFKVHYPKLSLVNNNGIALCKPCEDQAHGRELKQFIPKHIKVPSLKMMISNAPARRIPYKIRFLRWLRKLQRIIQIY